MESHRAGRPTRRSDTELPNGYPVDLERRLRLSDGRVVFVRPVVPTDIEDLRDAIVAADEQTLRDRFLGLHPSLRESDLRRLTEVDFRWRLALAAFDEAGVGVAIGRYEGKPGENVAEVAIVVDLHWRRVGLASRLLAMLAKAAVERGIRRFTAVYLVGNDVVEGLVRASGLPRTCHISFGVAEVEIDLAPLLQDVALGGSVAPEG